MCGCRILLHCDGQGISQAFFLVQPPQSVLTGGGERRDVGPDDVPEPVLADIVVVVTQPVSERPYIAPRLIWH